MPDAPARFAPPIVDRPAIPAAYGTGKASDRGAIAIRLRKVVTWSDITRNPTRFRFAR